MLKVFEGQFRPRGAGQADVSIYVVQDVKEKERRVMDSFEVFENHRRHAIYTCVNCSADALLGVECRDHSKYT